MTTVIKANGVTFSNPNLPTLFPVVTDGLVAMFRPYNSENGLIDLSGNGHTLTKRGNPEFTSTGVQCNQSNYLQTSVKETQSLTIMTVARVIEANQGGGGFFVGNFTNTSGSSIWFSSNNGNIELKGQSYVKKDGIDKNIVLTPIRTLDNSYLFVSMVIDAENGILSAYDPAKSINSIISYNVFSNSQSSKDRNIERFFLIGRGYDGHFPAKVEVSEVLFYNKALTPQQITQQYLYSKNFMKKHRNIDI